MPNLAPRFTMTNYTPLMDVEFDGSQMSHWFAVWEFFATMQHPFTTEYADVDVRKLTEFLQSHTPQGSRLFAGQDITKKDLLIACKLLSPTLRCCDYFFWNVGEGTHTGVDIMLPHRTPILSFTDGEVIRTKQWDGTTLNEGNCVVIKSTDGYVVGYEHLETIDVSVGQQITQGDQIGTCGTTGNSTQYHLHVQVDKWFAPFHPYRSQDLAQIKQYTIDPLPYFRARAPQSPFIDLPNETVYKNAIAVLRKAHVIKGFDRQVFPNNTIKRYEAALMIDRTMRLYSMYDGLPVVIQHYTGYNDNDLWDAELDEALVRLQKYGIMKGHSGNFYPKKQLLGEELLALLGRIFYDLSDNVTGHRWQNYLTTFIDEGIVAADRSYIGKAAPRKEVFLLFSIVLQRKGVI